MKRDTSGKKKQAKKKATFQLIPERKKYEMLCRGEGNKMVRKTPNHHFFACKIHFLTHDFNLETSFLFFYQTPRRQSRLFCRYYDNNRNPMYVLSPVKQQDEWDRPYIVRYLDIISDEEIEMVKKLAKPRVSTSQSFQRVQRCRVMCALSDTGAEASSFFIRLDVLRDGRSKPRGSVDAVLLVRRAHRHIHLWHVCACVCACG